MVRNLMLVFALFFSMGLMCCSVGCTASEDVVLGNADGTYSENARTDERGEKLHDGVEPIN